MLKTKITKNKIIIILSIIMITLSAFMKINNIYDSRQEKIKEEKAINEVINSKTTKEMQNKTDNCSNKVSKINNKHNYTAVLEIPKIGLKKGLVIATKNFKSINYAVSIDNNSKFPDEIGNFILYAHSGNSKISYFDKIKNLDIFDEIRIFYNNHSYKYSVIEKYEIDKNGKLSIYNDGISKYVTLTTCSQENKSKQIVILGKEINHE